ncbi:MAG: hypothetical protein V4683_08745 [Bacteroidota bacterium]
MQNTFKIGSTMYLLAIAELAIYNFFKGDFAMTRPRPLLESWAGVNPAMAYLSGTLLLIAVILCFSNRHKKLALFTIAGIIFCLATSRHIFNLWRDHINGFKSLWLISGALLFLLGENPKHKMKIIWLNIVIISLFFVDCGLAHFQYADFVKSLILPYIPIPLFWTYFTGVCLMLGGIGLLIPKIQRNAALLSSLMIGGWFLLLHIPRALTMQGDEWIGVGESLAISGICLAMYGSFQKSILVVN